MQFLVQTCMGLILKVFQQLPYLLTSGSFSHVTYLYNADQLFYLLYMNGNNSLVVLVNQQRLIPPSAVSEVFGCCCYSEFLKYLFCHLNAKRFTSAFCCRFCLSLHLLFPWRPLAVLRMICVRRSLMFCLISRMWMLMTMIIPCFAVNMSRTSICISVNLRFAENMLCWFVIMLKCMER